MKRLSKIFLISSSVTGFINAIFAFFASGLFVLFFLSSIPIYAFGITLKYFYAKLVMPIVGTCLAVLGPIFFGLTLLYSLFFLIGAALSAAGVTRIKVINIMNIIVGVLAFIPNLLFIFFGILSFLICAYCTFALPSLMMLPIGWNFFGFIVVDILTPLFALFSLFGGIFGLIRGKKQ